MIQEGLLSFLQTYPATRYFIAYSGGLDSHVLLHACAVLQRQHPDRFQFQAIHIHHGLQPSADAWVEHAQQTCAALAVPLNVQYLNLKPAIGDSIEAVARQARYQAFSEMLTASDMLLTAHHQQDQAETFLLNAIRGSGVAGLAAMPVLRKLGQGQLGRPLLVFSRQQLEAYATLYQLEYVDDPTNTDLKFDRNYLRHEILSRLHSRWPAVNTTLSRAAQLQAGQQQLLDQLLAGHLTQYAGSQANTLSNAALATQNPLMQKALLRQWLKHLGFSLPSAKKLQHILSDVLAAEADAIPCVAWEGCELRRYRDDIYALKPQKKHDTKQVIEWADLEQHLYLPSLEYSLDHRLLSADLKTEAQAKQQAISVRFRQGGERVERLNQHSLALKTLLQDTGIPPWERERIPLIYLADSLRLVVGVYPKT